MDTTKRCQAITRAGEPCRATPRAGRQWCVRHDPTLAEERATWDAAGGHGKSNTRRAMKRLPADLQDVLGALYRSLASVESGEMEPSRAAAMATISRAIVAVTEVGDVERRIAEIERSLKERAA